MNFLGIFTNNFISKTISKLPQIVIPFTETQQQTTKTYGLWMYGLIVGMSTVYGVKKGIQQWLEWKLTRQYKSLHNQNIDSIIDIACDGGTLAYYAMVNGIMSAVIASTAPISVPLLHFFRLDTKKIHHSFSADTFDTEDDDIYESNKIEDQSA